MCVRIRHNIVWWYTLKWEKREGRGSKLFTQCYAEIEVKTVSKALSSTLLAWRPSNKIKTAEINWTDTEKVHFAVPPSPAPHNQQFLNV
jgi:hypothetical protein